MHKVKQLNLDQESVHGGMVNWSIGVPASFCFQLACNVAACVHVPLLLPHRAWRTLRLVGSRFHSMGARQACGVTYRQHASWYPAVPCHVMALALLLLLSAPSRRCSDEPTTPTEATAATDVATPPTNSSGGTRHTNIPHEGAQAIQRCMTAGAAGACLHARTRWQTLTEHKEPCIAARHVWWSSYPPKLPVALVTQLSIDRLPALEDQCKAWAGPLAAVVYVPLLHTNLTASALTQEHESQLEAAAASVNKLFQDAEAWMRAKPAALAAAAAHAGKSSSSPRFRSRAGSCQLRVMLAYELHGDKKALILHPTNALRNYARLLADTLLILGLDVDLLPSESLSASLLRGWAAPPAPPGLDNDTAHVLAKNSTATAASETGAAAAGKGEDGTEEAEGNLWQRLGHVTCVDVHKVP